MLICIGAICIQCNLLMSTVAVIVASTVAYSLNQPCKEMLFVRTSRDIKYKAKSWSEMYGNQLMKMLGAQINLWINDDQMYCRPNCFQSAPTMAVSFLWVGLWLMVASAAGGTYSDLDADDRLSVEIWDKLPTRGSQTGLA